MAWSERTACRGSLPLNVATSSQLVSLPVAANPGDVVIAVVVMGGGPVVTASGLAGTWTAKRENVTSPGLSVLIGTGITVAGTDFTVSALGGTTGIILYTVLSGITDSAAGIGTTVQNAATATTSVSTSGTPISATAGRCMVAAASHPAANSTPNINAATWSTGATDTQAVTNAGGSTTTWRDASLDLATVAATASMSVSYTSAASGDWNVVQIELIPAPPGGTGSLTLGGSVFTGIPASSSGSLTLGGSGGAPLARSGAAGSLTLGGAPTAIPVYRASFTVDVGQETSDIPLLPADVPTVDYVGDDFSDLVDYPVPGLDGFGRPFGALITPDPALFPSVDLYPGTVAA